MTKKMMRNLAVAVALSFLFYVVSIFVYGTFTAFWHGRDHERIVLTHDVILYGNSTNNVLGILRRGTILFSPGSNDYVVTGPEDTYFYKVYVRLSPSSLREMKKLSYGSMSLSNELQDVACDLLQEYYPQPKSPVIIYPE